MLLSPVDLAVVAVYLLTTVTIGLAVRRRAARNLDAYYLGGRSMPWYLLSLSNASTMFDISGTMWLVTLGFVYGLKSIWIPWLWPVFNQLFLMAYLSAWLRRSNVLTGAEWIRTRFGDGTGGKLSHLSVVVFALIGVLGFLAYGFVGVGKFLEVFVPWEAVAPWIPFDVPATQVPHVYGVAFTVVATIYVMFGGMIGVVWTDLLQFLILTVSAVVIAAVAMASVSHEALAAMVPDGWTSPFFGWTLDLDWRALMPEVGAKIASDGYSLFGILVMMMVFKGVLVSVAGPAPSYDMQKILATRSPREAALMSGFVSVALMPVRYLMIAGFTVLAVVYYQRLDLVSGGRLDFENVLPSAIRELAPQGFVGLLLAGFVAAFMSTFASTLNAGNAYLINDLYKRYVNPGASRKQLIYGSYAACVVVVALSTLVGLRIGSINSLLQWLVSGLWGGYVASNVLKWHWWRLNGAGYFAGMASGIVCALSFPALFAGVFPGVAPDILPLYLFPLLLLVSGAVCVATSLATAPDEEEVLTSFYKTVRPWGFWKPIHDKVCADDPAFRSDATFGRDMANVAVGTAAQTALVALPLFVVIQDARAAAVTVAVVVAAVAILKKTWYERLAD